MWVMNIRPDQINFPFHGLFLQSSDQAGGKKISPTFDLRLLSDEIVMEVNFEQAFLSPRHSQLLLQSCFNATLARNNGDNACLHVQTLAV